MASYIHRQDADRLVLLPLHVATRTICATVVFPCFYMLMVLATVLFPSESEEAGSFAFVAVVPWVRTLYMMQ